MSWYETGYDGVAKEEQRLEESQGPQRFYIKAGEQKDFVFVDDEPFCFHEHNPRIGGSFRNWFTCMQAVYPDDVVCCKVLGPSSRYYVGYYTVVDCSKWKDQKGNEHQYELRYLQAKKKTINRFKRKKADKGSLIDWYVKATREDDKSPSCGDDFEYERKIEMEKLFPLVCYRGEKLSKLWEEADSDPKAMERLKRIFRLTNEKGELAHVDKETGKLRREIPPFNYPVLLHPKDPKTMRLELAAADTSDSSRSSGSRSSNNGAGSGATTDDVPF